MNPMSPEARVTRLEQSLADLAEAQMRTARNLDRHSEETARNLDRLSAEMRAFRDEMGRKWGELANKMGTLVEDIVAPSIPAVFARFFSLERLQFAAPRVRRWQPSDRARTREFDYLAISDRLVLVNETKSTLRPEDIPAFLALLSEARAFLPEAEGRELVGSLAALQIDPSLVTVGEREGLLMFGLGGGLLDVLNSAGFTPRRF